MSARRFHHREFQDINHLAELKAASSGKISVCIPTLNEARTIGPIVESIRRDLMEAAPLVDEILVIDSGSTDATLETAVAAGASAFLSEKIAPVHGTHVGKGENLWKALHIAKGDIICYIDGDILNFRPAFVTGLVGPLLTDSNIRFVKAFYERPLSDGNGAHTSGGGRVSEILIRPLLSLFYPELTCILQPLAGEYAARRELLESLSFPTGYGVEIAHLIDLLKAGELPSIAQTDLDKRIHRNRGDGELGVMAFALLRVLFKRLERDGKLTLLADLPQCFRSWSLEGGIPSENHVEVTEPERPPLRRSSPVTRVP